MSKTPEQVIGTSASDCELTMMRNASAAPVKALVIIAETLHYMNANNIEKASHRRALMKVGRKALTVLGDA